MTKRELFKELEGYDDDAEVHFVYDYGDHWHTSIASPVDEADMGDIAWSDYHSDYKVVDAEEHDDDVANGHSIDREVKNVILLKAHG